VVHNRRVAPTASYRIQLTPDFGFDDARSQLDTIRELGVSHLYLSPIAQAVPASSHGYDVVDHTTVRREFGGAAALDRLLDAAGDHAMGVIVDHVPNHVSVARAELNDVWWTMLRDGASSEAARWFDVDWDHGDGRVIIPRLAGPLYEVLSAGGLEVGTGDRGPELRYGPLRFPLALGTEGLPVRDAVVRQHYSLEWWRSSDRNVRRFFTIDDLVAVRVEQRDVAAVVDTIPRLLVGHEAFHGIRVDHIDGLADPGGYLAGLRDAIGDRLLFVEKILGPGERLPSSWPVDGTTGYEHITAVEHAFVDPRAERTLMELWTSWVDDVDVHQVDFHQVEIDARREVLGGGLAPDLDRVTRSVMDADGDADAATSARSVLVAMTLALDRYRTYLPDDPASRKVFAGCVAAARKLCPPTDVDSVVGVLDGVALTRWQQMTGPVMAKGAEDRAFYRYLPLASFCEVGGAPGHFSTSVAEFHRFQSAQQAHSPAGMVASTTHDTKRSQGVRARSLALAARAHEWVSIVRRWAAHHADLVDGIDPRLVILALQTVVTARPLTTERLTDYLVKSAREADLVTSWTEPVAIVEEALRALADTLVDEVMHASGELPDFASGIERHGATIDLALLGVQLTSPGFADLYQGSPQGLFSLVDPDNRRPPDWPRLRGLTDAVDTSDTASEVASGAVDRARTIMTRRILHLRARRPDAFGVGAGYAQIDVVGPGASDVLSFARSDESGPAIVVVTTRAVDQPLDAPAVMVSLPPGTWRSVLHDDAPLIVAGPTPLIELIGDVGLAILERTAP